MPRIRTQVARELADHRELPSVARDRLDDSAAQIVGDRWPDVCITA